jgi:Carboxypeptidase regulatory-like domain/TonB dependent receptor
MRGRSRLLSAVLAFAFFLVCTDSAFAQGGAATAQLNGTVTDPSGGSVAGASISVRNTATNITSTGTSNDRGFYAVANLTPGNYELKVSYKGFANFTQTGIVLLVGQSATINVGLQVASQGERVVVTTEVPEIEPTKTEISQVVGTQQIEDLPTSGRLFTDFALLTPGVAVSRTSLGTTFTEYETTQISFGGMRGFSNEITVDGADFVNTASGVQRATPPQDSVQEFRVVNNSFGAESGKALGGIVNIVTKSGTNDLHGSLYEYFQNDALDSRNLLQKPEPDLQSELLPDTLQQNQFGARVGGPIQKDKTFFFANYEAKRYAESPLLPPDLVNNIQVIDQAKATMGIAPEGCSKSLAICLPAAVADPASITESQALSFLEPFERTSNNDYGFARLDHQFNDSNRLAVRYNVEDSRNSGELVGQTLDGGGIGVPSGGRDLFIRDQSLVATLDSTLSPTLVNSALFQYARRHYNFPGATGQPDFSIVNDLELGHNFGTNDRLYESRAEFGDSLSWVKGNHILKFGFDGSYVWSLENFPGFMPTRMLIPSVACMADFAKFYNTNPAGSDADLPMSAALLNSAADCSASADDGVVFTYAGVEMPASPTFTAGPPLVGPGGAAGALNTATWANAFPPSLFNTFTKEINHGYWGPFIQDQWRITPKLTLNFGLRWDYESGLAEFVNPDYGEWQPRVGLAWSPDSKTVVRAGFGLFDDRYNLTFFFVPNTQKVVPGLGCNPPVPACSAAVNKLITGEGVNVSPQVFPMTNALQANQGYQIYGFPAGAGAAAYAATVIDTGGYTTAPQTAELSITGTCDTDFACGVGAGGMAHNARVPYAEQASLEVDRQLGKGLALDLGYLFVGAHRLVRGNNINVPCPVGTTDPSQNAGMTVPPSGVDSAIIDPGSWPAPVAPVTGLFADAVPGLLSPSGTLSKCASGVPALGTNALANVGPFFQGAGPASGLQSMSYGLLDYNNDVSNAIYHGGTVTVIERLKYFNLTANYTYSHTIDNGNFTTFINLPPNQFDYHSERANSNQDVRHRFVGNFTALGPEDTWVRHFTLSSIITLQSGSPFTIYSGEDTLNDVAGLSTDRVAFGSLGNICTSNCGARYQEVCPSASDCATMIPRNTYIGDPLYTWDFHLSRYFQLAERMKLEVGVDAFNFLNRSNVDEVTSVYNSPVFCGAAIPRHYRDAASLAIQAGSASMACPTGFAGETPVLVGGVQIGNNALTPMNVLPGVPVSLFIPSEPSPTFGLPRTMFNPRQFQFSARFDF